MRITALVYFVAGAAAAPFPVLTYPGLHDNNGTVLIDPGHELTQPIRIDPPSSKPNIIACDPQSPPQGPCIEVPLPAPGKPGRSPGPGPGPVVKKCRFPFPGSRCILVPDTDQNATRAHPEPPRGSILPSP